MVKKVFKIIFKTLLIVVAIFAFLIIGLNAFKHPFYSKYYNVKEDVAYNQGLGDGFVSQGVAKVIVDGHEYYFTSGYMSNGEPSRVYINNNKTYYYVNIKLSDYELSYDHFGGITATKDNIYLTGEKAIYEIPITDFAQDPVDKPVKSLGSKTSVKAVKVKNSYEVDVQTSYIYADPTDTYLYVGEFNYGPYKTNHETSVNFGNETYYAYVNCYLISKLGQEDALQYRFAVRDKVQGFAIADGKIVLSTSYSVPSSTLYVYNIPQDFDKDNIYYLDNRYLSYSIKAPSMMEALDYCPEKKQFITLFESACNKYFFGKFFLANKIVGLTL